MLTKKQSSKSDVKTPKNANTTPPPAPPAKSKSLVAKAEAYLTTTPHKTESCCPTTKSQQKTRVTVKYDVGYSNALTIRGKGANLNWEKGQLLKNVKADEWVFETDTHFSQIEFKVLINDQLYERGENHLLNCGSNVAYTPKF
jgi:hypothetical protein